MARAETIDVGETAGGGNNSLPCRTWPTLCNTAPITRGSGTAPSPARVHRSQQHLHSLQTLYLSYPLPYPQPGGRDKPQAPQQQPALSPSPTPPPSPPCERIGERGGGALRQSAFLGEPSDSDREERPEAPSRRGPLPDLLPQNERPSWGSQHHRAPRGEAAQQLEVRRLASQLRTIGDEFNATVMRAHDAPHWQDWRDACRGFLNFIAQTLSTLYRLT